MGYEYTAIAVAGSLGDVANKANEMSGSGWRVVWVRKKTEPVYEMLLERARRFKWAS